MRHSEYHHRFKPQFHRGGASWQAKLYHTIICKMSVEYIYIYTHAIDSHMRLGKESERSDEKGDDTMWLHVARLIPSLAHGPETSLMLNGQGTNGHNRCAVLASFAARKREESGYHFEGTRVHTKYGGTPVYQSHYGLCINPYALTKKYFLSSISSSGLVEARVSRRFQPLL